MRSRPLVAPRGTRTRPTPARVREALFSILGERVEGCRVLDLFAGTGALGLEALSRGAAHATFVDNDRQAQVALKKNLQTAAAGQVTLLPMAAARALRLLGSERAHFGLVFLDPPYSEGLLAPTLALLAGSRLLDPEALLVCEHHGKAEPPEPPAGFEVEMTRRYGDVAITLFGAAKGTR